MFCAARAGARNRRTLLIEHNSELGRKIIVSGGGRCNFTNLHTTHENFVSSNPHFCKSALAGYTPYEFIELVKTHKIDFFEKKLGQLFCTGRSRQIVDMLTTECRRARVAIKTNCSVRDVRKKQNFEVETSQGLFECESLVIATGGLSFPKIGATGLGYRLAGQFGIKVVQTRPSCSICLPWRFRNSKACRYSRRCRSYGGQKNISGKHSLYSSRPFRSCYFAGVKLLASR